MKHKDYWSFDEEAYNALPTLERASSLLRQRKDEFDRFMRAASSLLSKNDFGNGEFGALLLHRHWSLEQGEQMIETPRLLRNGRIAVITCSVNARGSVHSGVRPSKWAASDDAQPILALEFSSDPSVLELNARVARKRHLLTSLSRLLNEYQLQNIVGYMIIPRKTLMSYPCGDFVEINVDNMSVVTAEKLTPSQSASFIKTAWPLARRRTGSVWGSYYCGRCAAARPAMRF